MIGGLFPFRGDSNNKCILLRSSVMKNKDRSIYGVFFLGGGKGGDGEVDIYQWKVRSSSSSKQGTRTVNRKQVLIMQQQCAVMKRKHGRKKKERPIRVRMTRKAEAFRSALGVKR